MKGNPKQYALYRGDELLMMATVKEIAKEYGIKEDTVRSYGTPAYMRKIYKNYTNKVLILVPAE